VDIHVKAGSSSIQSLKPFEGIIPMLSRRYLQTESDYARNFYSQFMKQEVCSTCQGLRLKPELQNIKIGNMSIGGVTTISIAETLDWLKHLSLSETQMLIVDKLLKEITSRLEFLIDVGLDYLTLHRRSDGLSGGEMQRIRLATQIGTKLTGVLYVLDEPSIGLHQKDNDRLIQTLLHLRDLGNSLIVVEHDEQIIRIADFIVDIGKNAGVYGGSVLTAGSLEDVLKNEQSLTAAYLSGKKGVNVPSKRREGNKKFISIKGIETNNLKKVDLKIPLAKFVAVTGVSGSGKSSLISETLLPVVSSKLGLMVDDNIAVYKEVKGTEAIDSIISIDQKPIGRTPRSNPSTYVNLFGPIRDLFASTTEAKVRGYAAGRFSFNVKGGRCENCNGDGIKKIEMHFLADIYVTCEVCNGKRYNKETLDIYYKGKNIYEVLEMSVIEAYDFFKNHSKIEKILKTLIEVGLDYIKLGQNSTTLSGGEAQRIKLSKELAKRFTGNTLYVLDEPTTGLHFADVHKLVDVLNHLVDLGNTVVVIEHNLDVIKVADHIIDVGQNGGINGGEIIAQGTPEEICKIKASYTGYYLKDLI
jgi:excinuclease ABC subunit A